MRPKLATLSLLEWIAGLARRLGLGFLVDRLAPLVARPFERFELDVDGVRLAGTELAHLHYVRELMEDGREQTFVRLLTEAIPAGGVVLEGGAHLGFVTVHAARAAGPDGRVITFEANPTVLDVLRENLAANGVADRVEVVPKALGESAGRTRFYVSGGGEMSSLFAPAVESVPVEVEVARADEEVSAAGRRGQARHRGWRARRAARDAEPASMHPDRRTRSSSNAIPTRSGARGRPPRISSPGSPPTATRVEWIDERRGRTAPLTEPWSEAYVNLRCTRVA